MKTPIRKSHLKLTHGQIYYEIHGSGEPIVFIHGFTLDRRMWQPQIDYFSPRFQVITYDARGFGKSSIPTIPYSHVEDLFELLSHLAVTKVHLVGLSMGGRIAVNFILEHPDMVRSLTLLDAALDGYKDTVDWSVHAEEVGIEGAKDNWVHHELFGETRNHTDVMVALDQILNTYSGWHWTHTDPQLPISPRARTRLHEITVPTLIAVGEKDLDYFHNIATVLAAGISNSTCVDIPGAGHMVNMEAPESINTLIDTHILES